MPESVTPLIAVGVVIVLFIVLLSVLTSKLLAQRHQIQNRWRRPAWNCALGNYAGS